MNKLVNNPRHILDPGSRFGVVLPLTGVLCALLDASSYTTL